MFLLLNYIIVIYTYIIYYACTKFKVYMKKKKNINFNNYKYIILYYIIILYYVHILTTYIIY